MAAVFSIRGNRRSSIPSISMVYHTGAGGSGSTVVTVCDRGKGTVVDELTSLRREDTPSTPPAASKWTANNAYAADAGPLSTQPREAHLIGSLVEEGEAHVLHQFGASHQEHCYLPVPVCLVAETQGPEGTAG